MAVSFYLYCKETRHGVMVGQSSMGIPCDLAESKSVISLFCLAHQMNDLIVVADPDLESSWDEDTAEECFRELTRRQVPEAWKHLKKS